MKKRVHLRTMMEIQAAYFEILAGRCYFELYNNKKSEQREICHSTKPKWLRNVKVSLSPDRSQSFREHAEVKNM